MEAVNIGDPSPPLQTCGDPSEWICVCATGQLGSDKDPAKRAQQRCGGRAPAEWPAYDAANCPATMPHRRHGAELAWHGSHPHGPDCEERECWTPHHLGDGKRSIRCVLRLGLPFSLQHVVMRDAPRSGEHGECWGAEVVSLDTLEMLIYFVDPRCPPGRPDSEEVGN